MNTGSNASDSNSAQLQDLAVAPDVAPWVSARAGLGNGFEGGLTASTRALRLDGRRAFEGERFAFSVGLGGSALLAARPQSRNADGVFGGGFDVPLIVGLRSSSDLYSAWGGVRVGADFFSGQLDLGADQDPVSASGRHLRFGGVLGGRIGFRHVHGFLELELTYHDVAGSLGTASAALQGLTFTPAAGILITF
ncbi:MAG: hypothetical protein IPK82_34695 [Polyangiaceae bacterium]|nr:hypothetical protein [Polyangiaceae bacterium]